LRASRRSRTLSGGDKAKTAVGVAVAYVEDVLALTTQPSEFAADRSRSLFSDSLIGYCAGQSRELADWRLPVFFGFQDDKDDNGGNQDQGGDKLSGRHLGTRDHSSVISAETLYGKTGCAVEDQKP